jgi:acetyl esterase/lipase
MMDVGARDAVWNGPASAILTAGTRDLFLSNTVRAHRKLREAGVVAELRSEVAAPVHALSVISYRNVRDCSPAARTFSLQNPC